MSRTEKEQGSAPDPRIQLRVTPADRVRLNILRARRDETMQVLIRTALSEWLTRNGEEPLQEIEP